MQGNNSPDLRLYQRWGPVLLLSALWALCQEAVPLCLPINMDHILQRVLLAGGSCAALGVSALCISVLLRFCRQLLPADNLAETDPGLQQELAPLPTEEVVQAVVAPLEACAPMEMGSGLPVSTGHALVDSLLVFLHLESLEEPSTGHIQELAAKLERADKALQRGADVDVLPQWGSKDGQILVRRLGGVSTYLQQRLLHTLVQTRRQCEDSERDIVLGLERSWQQLEKMHRRITVPSGTVGDLDVREVLKEVQGLSVELRQHREQLQVCQSHLAETTHILQELSRNRRELEQQAGVPTEPLWTEHLLQASAAQNEEICSKFLSLESIADCLRTHLEGLRVQGTGRPGQLLPGRESASSTCPPTLVEPPPSPADPSPPLSPSETSQSLIPAMDCLLCTVRR